MNAAEVAELAAMLDGTHILELSLTEAGETITLRRNQSPLPLGEGWVRAAATTRDSGPAEPSPGGRGGSREVVAAPCPGIFLVRHPSRDEELAVVGRVTAGTVVALLRVGPLLVPVEAPRAGVVSGPEAVPGSLVGYGTVLFRLQPEE